MSWREMRNGRALEKNSYNRGSLLCALVPVPDVAIEHLRLSYGLPDVFNFDARYRDLIGGVLEANDLTWYLRATSSTPLSP